MHIHAIGLLYHIAWLGDFLYYRLLWMPSHSLLRVPNLLILNKYRGGNRRCNGFNWADRSLFADLTRSGNSAPNLAKVLWFVHSKGALADTFYDIAYNRVFTFSFFWSDILFRLVAWHLKNTIVWPSAALMRIPLKFKMNQSSICVGPWCTAILIWLDGTW